ncbi:DUF948 domain-containing protein [Paenibacillus psychroresistens]|uniref:DUF948 domain-containing protein n=1 Tax=Paenibacillus psychroresistens TaxID=1778678 RepID=A0A6B8RLY2_9BACL|nr:DUF948 domain-containing protein [Paenibacillus psychroresistens]QGQ96338.1 DUF948 domain-containing protein [Paenibacillus psychroresistens]
MIIKASVAIIAIAFVVLVVYLIRILIKGMGSLEETNKTLSEVRNAIHGLTQESKQLIHTANQITTDVKGKIKTVEPIFESAHEVGEALHSVTRTVKQAASVIGDALHPTIESEPRRPLQIKLK